MRAPGAGRRGRTDLADAPRRSTARARSTRCWRRVHPDVGSDFRRLLRLFESGFLGTFIAGSPRPFTRATPAEQDARLEAWRRRGSRCCAAAIRRSSGWPTPRTTRRPRCSRASGTRARPRCRRCPRERRCAARAHRSGRRAGRDVRARGRLRDRRQRRRRQRGGRGAGRGGRQGRRRRGGRPLHARRLQHAGVVGVPGALPGARQPRDRRSRDHDPAGAQRGRRHDGQLDVVVPHAGRDAAPVGRTPRRRRHRRGDAGAALRRRRGAPGRRPRQPRRRQREQPQAAGRRRQAGLEARADPPQRQGLRAPRLLRHGLPAGREANVAHDLPGRRDRGGRATSTPTAA